MRRALQVGILLAVSSASCFRQTAKTSSEAGPGPIITVPLTIMPETKERGEEVPVYASATLTIHSPDAGTILIGEAKAGDGGIVRRQLLASGWFAGSGPYTFELGYEMVDGGTSAVRQTVELSGTERVIEGRATLFGDTLPPELELTIVERPPPSLKVEQLPRALEWAEASIRITNTSTTESYFFAGPAPDVRVERKESLDWTPTDADANCGGGSFRPESALSPGASIQVDVKAQFCRLRPVKPGQYRYVLRLNKEPWNRERSSPAWMLQSVTRVVEIISDFDAPESDASQPTALFGEIPAHDLRQRSGHYSFRGEQFGAVVVAPDGGSACACLGSHVGREGSIAVAGTGDICLAPESDPSVKACKPLHQIPKVRVDDSSRPLPDLLPPYPYEQKRSP